MLIKIPNELSIFLMIIWDRLKHCIRYWSENEISDFTGFDECLLNAPERLSLRCKIFSSNASIITEEERLRKCWEPLPLLMPGILFTFDIVLLIVLHHFAPLTHFLYTRPHLHLIITINNSISQSQCRTSTSNCCLPLPEFQWSNFEAREETYQKRLQKVCFHQQCHRLQIPEFGPLENPSKSIQWIALSWLNPKWI